MAKRANFHQYLKELQGGMKCQQNQQGGRLVPTKPVEAIVDTSRGQVLLKPKTDEGDVTASNLFPKAKFTGDLGRDINILKGLFNRPGLHAGDYPQTRCWQKEGQGAVSRQEVRSSEEEFARFTR